MKKMLFALTLFVLSLTGCATIVYEAPADKKLLMATQTDFPPIKIKRKVWYVLWGLVPITSNSTADMVGLCKEVVRVQSYYGIEDILINAILGNFSIMTMSVEINCK